MRSKKKTTNKALTGARLPSKFMKEIPIFEPQIFFKSSERMSEVKDGSVQLIVTSPPYNVGKNYVAYNDNRTLQDYLDYLEVVWRECKRVLCTGGRIAINVTGTWRRPYVPLHVHITEQMLGLGLLMRGVIYWDKGTSVGISTAWGSWRSGSNPTLRDVGEHILIFCKDSYKLESSNSISTISSAEFAEYSKSLWSFGAVNSRKEGHPAPFPEELPRRLIKFYTFLGDTVLDPFLGSGTTCKAAKALGRRSIGYEVNDDYRKLIEQKISSVLKVDISHEDLVIRKKRILGNPSPA